MNDDSTNINITHQRKTIAEFLGTDISLKPEIKDQYDKLYKSNYIFPVKLNIYKLIASIVILSFLILHIFAPLLSTEWIRVLVSFGMLAISFFAFNFVRKIKYPNEEFNVYIIIVANIAALFLLLFDFFNEKHLMENILLLESNMLGVLNSKLDFNQIKNCLLIFSLISLLLSIGALVYGALMGKKRFGSIMTPLVVVGGCLLFFFISNFAFSSDYLNNVVANNGDPNYVTFYLILIGSILAMVAYDLVFIQLSILIGGKKSAKRYKNKNKRI